MLPRGARLRNRVGVASLGIGLLGLVLAAFVGAGGGFDLRLAGWRISVHNPLNPWLGAAIAIAVGVRLAGGEARRRLLDRLSRLVMGIAPWLGGAASLAVLVASMHFGAFVAGSADSSGYLSEARLWREGSLVVPTPLSRELSLTNGQQPFAPLGYRPARDPHAIVPTYPPGFPLMLAAASRFGADRLVVPLSAALVVWLTYLLGHRLAGRVAGLIGAALAAGSSALWYQAMQPMSDVPATLWFTTSVWLLTFHSPLAALGAGLAAAMAGLVRPNLFVLTPVLIGGALWWYAAQSGRLSRSLVFLVPIACAAAGFAVLQGELYGGAVETGYGTVTNLFSLVHVTPNLVRYPAWLIESHSPLMLLAFAAPFIAGRVAHASPPARLRTARIAWTGLAAFAALFAFYALYLVFDEWVYVRFLLPALPWMCALAGCVVAWASVRLPAGAEAPVILVTTIFLATAGVVRARDAGAFRVGAGEQRFVAMADFLRTAGPDAIVLAMQHSGSVAYYTTLPVLRWDWIEPVELLPLLDGQRARGRTVYAVLDDWEVPRFNERFRRVPFALPTEPLARAGVTEAIRAEVYRFTGTTTPASAAPVSR